LAARAHDTHPLSFSPLKRQQLINTPFCCPFSQDELHVAMPALNYLSQHLNLIAFCPTILEDKSQNNKK